MILKKKNEFHIDKICFISISSMINIEHVNVVDKV